MKVKINERTGRKLNELLELEPGWHWSGEGDRISETAVNKARAVIEEYLFNGEVHPAVSPSVNGGVALEWGVGEELLTIDIASNGDVETNRMSSRS